MACLGTMFSRAREGSLPEQIEAAALKDARPAAPASAVEEKDIFTDKPIKGLLTGIEGR